MDKVKTRYIDNAAKVAPLETTLPAPEAKKNEETEGLTLEKHLYDSLLRKKRLFKMLVSEGKIEKPTGEEIQRQIKQALADLEEITRMTS